MQESTWARGVAERVISQLNGGASASVADFVDRSFTVHSSLLPSGVGTSLTGLRDACRQQYVSVQFDLVDVAALEHGFMASCIAKFKRSTERSHAITSTCTCRVQCKSDGKLHKMWFNLDQYEILRQSNRLCSEPGCAANLDSANQDAVELMKVALRTRSNFTEGQKPFLLHASVELFKNLDVGIETELWRLEGVGKFDELVRLIHAKFSTPIDISLGQGISQGFTSTFRGYLRGAVASMHQRYTLSISVRSSLGHVNECWAKIAPPLTLLECLS